MKHVRKAVFLDRDGTINVDKGYVWRVRDFEFLPGAIDALRSLQDAGYALVVITNQSGIARGLYSEDDYRSLERWMLGALADAGVRVAGSYHCPHHPDFTGACGCRKPSTGMFYQAVEDLGIELDGSWAVGDSMRDLSICDKTGCRGVLIGSRCTPAVCSLPLADSLQTAAGHILKEVL